MKKARLNSITKNHIQLDIDKLNAIDYTKQGIDKYKMKDLREMLINTIINIQNDSINY